MTTVHPNGGFTIIHDMHDARAWQHRKYTCFVNTHFGDFAYHDLARYDDVPAASHKWKHRPQDLEWGSFEHHQGSCSIMQSSLSYPKRIHKSDSKSGNFTMVPWPYHAPTLRKRRRMVADLTLHTDSTTYLKNRLVKMGWRPYCKAKRNMNREAFCESPKAPTAPFSSPLPLCDSAGSSSISLLGGASARRRLRTSISRSYFVLSLRYCWGDAATISGRDYKMEPQNCWLSSSRKLPLVPHRLPFREPRRALLVMRCILKVYLTKRMLHPLNRTLIKPWGTW